MWPHFYVSTFTTSKHYYLMIVTINQLVHMLELKRSINTFLYKVSPSRQAVVDIEFEPGLDLVNNLAGYGKMSRNI